VWFALAPALAIAAVLLVVGLNPSLLRTPGPDILPKGAEPTLRVFQQADASAERVEPGETLPAGAVVQLAYEPAGFTYGVIVSIDGNGAVTLHHPTDSTGPTDLVVGGQTHLDDAYRLDDAPEFERFFMVVGAEPVPVSVVLDAASTLASSPNAADGLLVIDGPWTQLSHTVRKP
jgi:hypothetical protein